jgi:hypothetical protein
VRQALKQLRGPSLGHPGAAVNNEIFNQPHRVERIRLHGEADAGISYRVLDLLARAQVSHNNLITT